MKKIAWSKKGAEAGVNSTWELSRLLWQALDDPQLTKEQWEIMAKADGMVEWLREFVMAVLEADVEFEYE